MTMATKNEEKWMANYEALKAYIDEHHHLPECIVYKIYVLVKIQNNTLSISKN